MDAEGLERCRVKRLFSCSWMQAIAGLAAGCLAIAIFVNHKLVAQVVYNMLLYIDLVGPSVHGTAAGLSAIVHGDRKREAAAAVSRKFLPAEEIL